MPKPDVQTDRKPRWYHLFLPDKTTLLAGGLGAASVLAFAPFYLSPVMVGALAWLFWLWHKAESWQARVRLGLWFGLGLFGVGVSWLFSSMYFYSGMSAWLSALATFLWVFFLSLYPALAGALVSFFYRKDQPGLGLVLIMPFAWVLMELLRSQWFTGFPFMLTGNTHLSTWLDGYAPVLGTLGVSWAVALTAGLLVWLAHFRRWAIGATLFAAIWLGGALLKTIDWTTPKGDPVDVALIQGNVSQSKKWQKTAFMPTLKTYVGLTRKHLDADVVVWPETAIPAYFDLVQNGVLKSFLRDASLLNKSILMGVITRNPSTGAYYNALVNAGNPSQVYEKYHLVPFSEYFPWSSLFKMMNEYFDIPFSEFSAGPESPAPMVLNGHTVGLSICYEMAFGEELARTAAQTDYLITVSNDAWFAHTLEPAQQLQDVQMRALELGREIARSTNTGYTAIVGTDGMIKQEIDPYETGVLRGTVQPYEGTTPFVRWHYWPLIISLSGIFAWLLFSSSSARRQPKDKNAE